MGRVGEAHPELRPGIYIDAVNGEPQFIVDEHGVSRTPVEQLRYDIEREAEKAAQARASNAKAVAFGWGVTTMEDRPEEYMPDPEGIEDPWEYVDNEAGNAHGEACLACDGHGADPLDGQWPDYPIGPIFSRESLIMLPSGIEGDEFDGQGWSDNVDFRGSLHPYEIMDLEQAGYTTEGFVPSTMPAVHPVDYAWNMLNDRMKEIRVAKAAKYTSTHPLDNYNNAAAIADTSVEQHMLGRCQEKITRISNILKALEAGDIGVQEVEADLNNNDIPDIAVIMQLVGASLWARVHAAEEN